MLFVTFSALASSCSMRGSDAPPIAPGQTGLAAQAWVVQQSDVVAFIRAHGGPDVSDFVPDGPDPVAVARLTWTPQNLPTSADYNIVVLDPSGQDAAINLQTEGANGQLALGWDGRLDVLSKGYPFLAPTAQVPVNGGFKDTTMRATFRPSLDAPMWVIARFHRHSAIDVSRPSDSPIVAAFLTGADEKIWWASPLTTSPLS